MRKVFLEETFPILMAFFAGECFSILVGKIEFRGGDLVQHETLRTWWSMFIFDKKKTEILNIDTHVSKKKAFTKPIILGIHSWNLRVLLS